MPLFRLLLPLVALLSEQVSSFNLSEPSSRRQWIAASIATITAASCGNIQQQQQLHTYLQPPSASADEGYDNPNMPPGPEERSGLVVLRVAEVCDFQEKILRAIVNKDIDTIVSPQQIVFGTQVLLRNSNIAGNMKLMIDTEIPESRRDMAVKDAVNTMNKLQSISTTAAKVMRPFTPEEMLGIADQYRDVRLSLNNMYEYLPQDEKDKYYGYFMKVTEYEKKIAEGVYNPELDGVLKLEY